MDFINVAIQRFPLWAQWITSWGMRLYPSYDWSYWAGDYGEFPFGFTSKFSVKAYQVVWQNWLSQGDRVRKRGIVAEFTVEDILLLSEMDAYKRVTALKSILHRATQAALVVCPGRRYPTFHRPIAQEIEGTLQVRKER